MTSLEEIIKDEKEGFKDYPQRLNHIMGVYDKAMSLAKFYHLNEEKIAYASILHDYTKMYSLEKQKELMEEYHLDLSIAPSIYHAYTSSEVARRKYGVLDEEILEAIKYHTTGCANITDTLKVLMIADITEENTRTYDLSNKIREIEFKSIDEAIIYKLHYLISDAKKKGYDCSLSENMLEKMEKN